MYQQINHFEKRQMIQLPSKKSKTFPIVPNRIYNHTIAQPIHHLTISYHDVAIIKLEDDIHFHQSQEYLKRTYKLEEFDNKIQLLGEYYKFHGEVPRLFMEGIGRLIEKNTQDKRLLQYNKVTHFNQSHKRPLTTTRIQPHQKLLKDIELSYDNFEKKEAKKIQKKRFSNEKKTMKRVISVQGEKGMMPQFKNGHYLQQINNKENKYKKPNRTKKNQPKKIETKKITEIKSHKPSANNSLASQKNLSRSKSKANLHVLQYKKGEQNGQKLKGKAYSHQVSQQNSFSKNTEKQENKNKILLFRSNSKNNFKENEKATQKKEPQKMKKSSSTLMKPIKGVKPSFKEQPIQKSMFRKAIELRKRIH